MSLLSTVCSFLPLPLFFLLTLVLSAEWDSATLAAVPVGVDPLRLARVITSGAAYGCALNGSLCYLAAGESGLLIYDLADPAHPLPVGTFATRQPARRVHLLEQGALVVEQSGGAELLDLSNPTHPVFAGEWLEIQSSDAVFVAEGQLFIAGGTSLRLVDVRDIHAPALIGRYDFAPDGEEVSLVDLRSVAARDGVAYGGDRDLLWVFDVSDPTHIHQLGATRIPQGDISDLVFSGPVCFAAARWGGLHRIDLTDPRHPRAVGEVEGLGGWPQSIRVSGGRAVAATEQGWVVFLDISNPYAPLPLGGYQTIEALDVWLVGGFCLVAGGNSGLEVVDLVPANPSIPSLPSSHKGSLAVRDSLAVLASDGQIRTLVLGNNGEATVVGDLLSGLGEVTQVAMGAGFASYVSVFGDIFEGGNFRTVDLNDPAHPRRLGSYDALDEIDDYALSGRYAYLSVQFQGLRILDLADPSSPVPVGELRTSRAVSVSAAGDLVCLAQGQNGVGIVDVRDPARPSLLGRFEGDFQCQCVLMQGSLCYAADASGVLRVLDVSQPEKARLLGTYTSSMSVKKLLITGPALYLWGNDQRLEALDVSDPTRIWRIGGNSMAVHHTAFPAADQGRVWISGFGDEGVTLLPLPRDILMDGSLLANNPGFHCRLYARPGEAIGLERSFDFATWIPVKTLIPGLLPSRLDAQVLGELYPAAFYRTRPIAP